MKVHHQGAGGANNPAGEGLLTMTTIALILVLTSCSDQPRKGCDGKPVYAPFGRDNPAVIGCPVAAGDNHHD